MPPYSPLCKYDIIHKTGSTEHIAMPPEKDYAMATDTCTKIGENRMCRFADMLADRHTDMLITIQCFLSGGGGA